MRRFIPLLILVMGFGILRALAQVPSVIITPATQRIQRDSSGVVRIGVEGIQHLHAYHVQISSDPRIVRCTRVRGLGFFNTQTFFSSMRDTVTGLTTVDEASLGPGGQSGSGDLVELRFLGLSNGSATLTFAGADFRDSVNQVIVVSTDSAFIEVGPPVAVHEFGSNVPRRIRVESYPNPFNPATTFRYYQDEPGRVTVQVLSVSGATVFLREQFNPAPGVYELIWKGEDRDGFSLSTGAYFVRVQASWGTSTTKVVLVK